VPANAVIFRTEGQQLAILDSDGQHVHLKSISQGRDFGTEIEVLAGISATDTIVVNPPDSLIDGEEVRVAKPKPAVATANGKPS
jgi:hypothetical protein